ncbi:MAG: hypothetical protein HVN35_09160 [Methanobacteriaceae archaeon]|nr:hypothetical protein [Methanobacteriaceae archaeon]
MALKRDNISKSHGGGYLFCNHCGGYYKLKKNESPLDFLKCECGNSLEYCKDRETLDFKVAAHRKNLQALDSFENRILERREALKDIFPKIGIGENYIKDMQEEEELWDFLDRESNIASKKQYLNILLEEERLMTSINQKKLRVKNPTAMDKILDLYQRTDPLVILSVVIVLLILILILVVFRG